MVVYIWEPLPAQWPSCKLSGKAAFDRDCLQFARDIASVGQLLEAEKKSENFAKTWQPF